MKESMLAKCVPLKFLLSLLLCAVFFFSLAGCGGGGSDADLVDDEGSSSSYKMASFSNYGGWGEYLSYIGVNDIEFEGTTVYYDYYATDGFADESGTEVDFSFDANGVVIMGEDEEMLAISANAEYLVSSEDTNVDDDAKLGFGIRNDFTGADNALADGEYKFLQLMDDERNTGTYVFTDMFDVTFNGDGTGSFVGDESGVFSYNISDTGSVTITEEPDDRGQISDDGSVILLYKYDDSDDFIYISLLIKESSGKSDASLNGIYNFGYISGDSGDGTTISSELESSFGTISFDGSGVCTITDVVGGSSGCTYSVASDGSITFSDGYNDLVGMISSDNELVSLVKDDSGNAGPFMVIGTKR